MQQFRYRLGLDLGTNSLGWAMILLDEENQPCKVLRLGVRLFDTGREPKAGSSLAVNRRGARQMRRRLDRVKKRRYRFLKELIRAGLLPENEQDRKELLSLNPLRLRAEAVTKELSAYEVGRALFQLQQRRGFKSGRKIAIKDVENEEGKIKRAISETRSMLDGRTIGQELWRRVQNGEPARARLVGEGQTASYTYYIERDMIAEEFDRIWEYQRQFNPEKFTAESAERLRDVLLFQRDLLPAVPGKCFYHPQEDRLPLATNTAQEFRLYQEVNNLRLLDKRTLETRPLTLEERDRLITILQIQTEVSFSAMRREILGKESRAFVFTVEQLGRRTKLLGNTTAAALAADTAFGERWWNFTAEEKDYVAELIARERKERVAIQKLSGEFGVSELAAHTLLVNGLEEEFLRIGKTAATKILAALKTGWNAAADAPLTYDKAVAMAGYGSHTVGGAAGVIFDMLPYYGEVLPLHTAPRPKSQVPDERQYGKIANPTVHLGLNQIRKVVNAIIERYGTPEQIVVEVGRELKNGEYVKTQIKAEQDKNAKANQELNDELEAFGVKANAENRTRLRLYRELAGKEDHKTAIIKCVYSGKVISYAKLFSNDYQVDHVLPFSRTLNNSFANKVLVHNSANRYKGNKTPFEAFGGSQDGYDWDKILDLIKVLPGNKQRLFAPDVQVEPQGFLERQLGDTQYLSRVAVQYLQSLDGVDVWSVRGALTSMLRREWGLNSLISFNNQKNREDHRHHAIDAAVVALTDRSTLQQASRAAQRAETQQSQRVMLEFPNPWQGFRAEMQEKVNSIVVSIKPDHGVAGKLHNDTAYGIERLGEGGKPSVVRHRVPLTTLKAADLGTLKPEFGSLPIIDVDSAFYAQIADAIEGYADKEWKRNLSALAQKTGRRYVRKREVLSVIPIFERGSENDPQRKPYKGLKGDANYCMEIFADSKGNWKSEIISRFTANTAEYKSYLAGAEAQRVTFSGKPLVMRLLINDCVVLGDSPTVYKVQKVSGAAITLCPVHEGNADARNRDKQDPFSFVTKTANSLRTSGGRKVLVTELGTVLDPGPLE